MNSIQLMREQHEYYEYRNEERIQHSARSTYLQIAV